MAAIGGGLLIGVPILRGLYEVSAYYYFVGALLIIIPASFRLASRYGPKVHAPIRWCVGIFYIFYMWMLLSRIWQINGLNYNEDIVLLTSLLSIVLFGSVAFTKNARIGIILIASLIALIVSVGLWERYIRHGKLNIQSLGVYFEYRLPIAKVIGVGAVSATLKSIADDLNKWWGMAGILSFTGVALSASVGIIVFSTLTTFIFSLIFVVKTTNIKRDVSGFGEVSYGKIVAIVAIAIFAMYWLIFNIGDVGGAANRLMRVVELKSLGAEGRISRWRISWKNIVSAPVIGYGLGSNGIMSGTGSEGYPHNAFLQVWLDGGIIGLSIFLSLMAAPYIFLYYRSNDLMHRGIGGWLPLIGVYTLLLLESLKSGNLYGARSLFLFWICSLLSICEQG